MRTIRIISVLAGLVVTSLSCFGAICVTYVSKEQAENEFDATLRTVLVTTNEVRFQLEFAPQGRLQTFHSVQLEMTARDGTLVSKPLAAVKRTAERVVRSAFTSDAQGNLSPVKNKEETTVVEFSIAPADLSISRLVFYYQIDSGLPPYAGIEFRIADFIKPEPNKSVEPTRAPEGARGSP